ncbi:MAG: undecaprenyl-diphosphatase UppP [Deltaproteobacteria bacterium RIFOXYD12_FULL_57_12]|nr:MAG: undecaprenyl-diphosphatase UppP [Deltaproteobacteria bacterium RIFOXYD12_FULL_57_12]
MRITDAIILGLLQGATEFLPVSSSGHLALAEHYLRLTGIGLPFDVALHMGTLTAVLVYFRQDFLRMAGYLINYREGGHAGDLYRRLAFYIVLGTLPAVLFTVLWGKTIEAATRAPWAIAAALAAGGVLLLAAERWGGRLRAMESLSLPDALLVGLAQAVAIVPGVSRSGITITAGLFLGLNRQAAARFSFLLSAPVILGAGVYHLPAMVRQWEMAGQLGHYLAGFAAAAVAGYLCIAFLIRFVQSSTLAVFAYYRFLVAALVLFILGG